MVQQNIKETNFTSHLTDKNEKNIKKLKINILKNTTSSSILKNIKTTNKRLKKLIYRTIK